MADITFPAHIKVLSWSESTNQPVLRSPMEDGTPKQKRRFTRILGVVSLSILMTEAQYNAFITWYLNDAEAGTKWFNFTDPRTLLSAEYRMIGGQFNASLFTRKQDHYVVSIDAERYF